MQYPVAIPPDFQAALDEGRPAEVVDHPVDSPVGFYARGLARTIVARRRLDARADFQAALPALGDVAAIELAFLQLRDPGVTEAVSAQAREIAQRAAQAPEPNLLLAARAFHVAGLAEDKRRRTAEAVDCLMKAKDLYGRSGCDLGQAQVLDSLGMVNESIGRLEDAVHHYALSIATKSVHRDRYGTAISLGNMGRVQLKAGRYAYALECLEADLRIANDMQDAQGSASVLNAMGRAYHGLGRWREAEDVLRRSLELATTNDFRTLRFFALKDLVQVLVSEGRLEDAEQTLQLAREAIPASAEPAIEAYWTLAHGTLLAAQRREQAAAVLQQAVDDLTRLTLPDYEIEARIELAKALLGLGRAEEAEACLSQGLRLARTHGLLRFLPVLNRMMTQLGIVDGAVWESRRTLSDYPTLAAGGFIKLGRLGGGAFGDVYRVYDSQRAEIAALKLLYLSEEYDPRARRGLIASARCELEAASHILHPGIVRVLAIGTLEDGSEYVLQELVEGPSLRSVITKNQKDRVASNIREVLTRLADIASALAELHAANIIHRDLKPDNIILRHNFQPVLVDFGIASLPGQPASRDERFLGTLVYMAPEQLSGKHADNRSDLYALGVTAYEWICGNLPIEPTGTTLDQCAREMVKGVPKALIEFRPDVPPEVGALVMDMLAKKPSKRPRNALEAAERCHQLLLSVSG